jgi:hypothetical protein
MFGLVKCCEIAADMNHKEWHERQQRAHDEANTIKTPE